MSLLAAMDSFVKKTGLYSLTMIERPQPRVLRWTPMLVLAGLAGGYASTSIAPPATPQGIIAGAVLFVAAYIAATYLRFLGPRLADDPAHPLDERELAVRAGAGRLSGNILLGLAMVFCLYMAFASAANLWQPTAPMHWTMLALAFQGAWMALPVLVASWLQLRPADDD